LKARDDSLKRASTGLDRLDTLLGGGFQRGLLILLVGEPGVGKTVFCANFIYSGWVQGEKGVYASFGEDRQTFLSNMRKHLGEEKVKCFTEGGCEYLDLVTVMPEGVSATFQAILEAVNRIGAKRLVIDPFTTLSLALKDPLDVRLFIHSVLGKIVRQLGCTTILVKEDTSIKLRELGVEEYVSDVIIHLMASMYVADAVLHLKTDVVEDNFIRVMELSKVRGSRLSERLLPYTLERGFKIINPFILRRGKVVKRWQPTADPPNRFSTGIPDLDKLLGGGFPRGSAALLEVDSKLTAEQYFPLIMATAANFLAKGRPVILTLPLGIIPATIEEYAKLCGFTDEEINKLMRICVIEGQYPEEVISKRYVWSTKPKDLLESMALYNQMEAELRRSAEEKVVFNPVGLDNVYGMFGLQHLLLAINRSISSAAAKGDLRLYILKPGIPSKALYQMLYSTTELHFRIFRKHGVLFVYGVKPRTPLHAVEAGERSFVPRLIPIV